MLANELAAVVFDYKPSENLDIFIVGNDFLMASSLFISGRS